MSEIINALKTKEGNNVWILVADFAVTDFKKLQEEYNTKGYITWESKIKVKTGDICYFYYSHLPSDEGDNQNRIVLRAVIKEGRHNMTRGEIWGPEVENAEVKTDGFTFTDIEPISLTDSRKYNYYELVKNKEYNLNFTRPTNTMLTEKNIKLYEEIEKEVSKKEKSSNNGFDELISYFEVPCYFEKTMHPKNPQTFIAKNGLRYFDKHHFIQQHTYKLIDESLGRYNYIYDVIRSDENLITLCACCHKKIHLGRPEEIEKMLKTIYDDKKEFFDEKMKKYIGKKNVFDWIKTTYKLEKK